MARYVKRLQRQLYRLDARKVYESLRLVGEIRNDTLFVHSSLSACGFIKGGPPTVIKALGEWLGTGKNLVLPTHTYCYPKDNGKREVFDPQATRSVVGAITDYFWRQPGVTRSLHPTHSLAAVGPAKRELCADHEICDTPCGRGTPYERLIERDSAVLMFGATMNAYTLFHTLEDAAHAPYLYEREPYELLVKGPSGSQTTVKMWRHDMKVPRRFEEMDLWLETRGALVRRPFGMGELLFISSSKYLHDLVAEEMRRNPFFLVASKAQLGVARRFEQSETIR